MPIVSDQVIAMNQIDTKLISAEKISILFTRSDLGN